MVFLAGRIEKTVIEKSYIDESGQLVAAGAKLEIKVAGGVGGSSGCLNTEATAAVAGDTSSAAPCASTVVDDGRTAGTQSTFPSETTEGIEVPTGPVQVPSGSIPNAYDNFDYGAYDFSEEDGQGPGIEGIVDGDGTRAPDPVRAMTLLGGSEDEYDDRYRQDRASWMPQSGGIMSMAGLSMIGGPQLDEETLANLRAAGISDLDMLMSSHQR